MGLLVLGRAAAVGCKGRRWGVPVRARLPEQECAKCAHRTGHRRVHSTNGNCAEQCLVSRAQACLPRRGGGGGWGLLSSAKLQNTDEGLCIGLDLSGSLPHEGPLLLIALLLLLHVSTLCS
jgi:hypothetical protein